MAQGYPPDKLISKFSCSTTANCNIKSVYGQLRTLRGLYYLHYMGQVIEVKNKPFICNEQNTQSSKSIKICIDLWIVKSIKISKTDLTDIDCIDQSIEIDDTLILVIDLSWFLPISWIYMGR